MTKIIGIFPSAFGIFHIRLASYQKSIGKGTSVGRIKGAVFGYDLIVICKNTAGSAVTAGSVYNSVFKKYFSHITNGTTDGMRHVTAVDNEESNRNDQLMTTKESEEKHREFEERRKRHYEMKNIKDLLA